MSIVTFDPTAFKARYPEFTAVNNDSLTACFNDAGLYLANTDTSPVQNVAKRTQLLWMLTAHIAYLDGFTSVDGKAKPVGRISSATEGSVSISLDNNNVPGTAVWFQQTQWGSSFWQATSYLRSFRYFPQRTRY